MNEKRAGEVVVDVLDSGVAMDLIVQSQKIMSEETGHYILIKRINERKNDHGRFSELSKTQNTENGTHNKIVLVKNQYP